MILAYFVSAKIAIENKLAGKLLNLGSSNLDEAVVGYYTKYDCSAADINPIASLTKHDIKNVLNYLIKERKLNSF